MKCYMCAADATTREHVPPRSFFPKGLRENLATVPSCLIHNHDQSLDIEYARNIITGFYGINTQGEQAFEFAKRSYDRSPALFNQTFRDFEKVYFNGDETGVFTIDLDRIKSVMRPIANALYFHDYGEVYSGQWKVFIPSMGSRDKGSAEQWQGFRDLLASIQFTAKPVPHPDIFTYLVHEMPDGFVWEFVFYGAFKVHCFGPKTA